MGRLEDAEKWYTEALEIDPNTSNKKDEKLKDLLTETSLARRRGLGSVGQSATAEGGIGVRGVES